MAEQSDSPPDTVLAVKPLGILGGASGFAMDDARRRQGSSTGGYAVFETRKYSFYTRSSLRVKTTQSLQCQIDEYPDFPRPWSTSRWNHRAVPAPRARRDGSFRDQSFGEGVVLVRDEVFGDRLFG